MNEDPVFILIRGILATYLNRLVENPNGKVDVLLDKILTDFKAPRDQMGDGTVAEIHQNLLTVLGYLRSLPKDVELETVDVIERVRNACSYSSDYTNAIERMFESVSNDNNKNENRIRSIVIEMSKSIEDHTIGEFVRQMNYDVNFGNGNMDLQAYCRDAMTKLREITGAGGGATVISKANGRFNTDEEETVNEAFEKASTYESAEGRLKTGLKGLNRMLGGDGYRRGEQFNIGGLTHSGKSLLLLQHGQWFCRFNDPIPPKEGEPERKPMILHVSFENKIEQNIVILYQSIYEEINQVKLDRRNIDVKEASKFIIEQLSKRGFTYEMLSFNPNGMDVWDLIEIINCYIEQGFEIYAICVDYPDLISKGTGRTNAKRRDEEIAYTFEILRNHCFERGITQITAHQLSTEAQKIARESPRGFAKKVATGSYYMECQSLATKLDGEMMVHKIKVGDDFYLSFARGKHRGGEHTPVSWQSGAYKFEELGGIVPDLDVEAPEGRCVYSFAGLEEPGETGGVEVDMKDMKSW